MTYSRVLFILASVVMITGSNCKKEPTGDAPFVMLRKAETGLNFQNVLKPTPAFNALNYMYFYNGGGVGAGDFNNDGLVDLYFTSNMGENKMFINKGNLKFTDVTEAAGVSGCDQSGCGWTTGASVVDINNDGMLDIYVSKMGDFEGIKGRNQLFVCQEIKDGIPVYEEQAIQYGIDLVGFGTQAAFLDYDLDGDLDLYQLNHSVHANGTFGQKKTFAGTQHPLAGDKLMRNDNGKFTEVTMQSGINSSVIGYGLGISTGDINLDGWPDIYVGNDFHENDYLYINQQDGTFKEVLNEQIKHTSQFSMGVDIADVNNDGWSDIISLDMLPEDPYILKSSLGEDDFSVYHFKLTYGYNHQYARNTLQKNNGDGTFSEVGMFAGVGATDWSWASLFLDFDNDGKKDLFISNGIERRMNDIDYANFRANNEIRHKQNTNNLEEKDLNVVEKMPKIKLPNKFFHNTGNFKFDDQTQQVGNAANSFSNGAIYADLDNDGDLEVIVSNQEDEPFLYKNMQIEHQKTDANKFLSLDLKGTPKNVQAIGARTIVYKKEEKLITEKYPVRGYQSSALTRLHVGIGDSTTVDSILLVWPDNTCQRLEGLRYNQTHKIEWKPGLPKFNYEQLRKKPTNPFQFTDISAVTGLGHLHVENPFVEFDREALIPNMASSEGPALAVGDVNGDGLEDVFFGSCKRERSALYYQNPGGTFTRKTPQVITNDSLFEDVDAVFVDLENDGDLDLVVAAGGNEYRGEEEAMRQRAYINDGKGEFRRMDFPKVLMTASCVLAADYNKDGLVDLFFGARALPYNHGVAPSSTLLLNKGNNTFEDVTDQVAKDLRQPGMVKNGAWTDIDSDGDMDLILAIEWKPITMYLNTNGNFTAKLLDNQSGWWNFILPYDFDGDGDIDIIAGNTGTNSKFKPTKTEPVRMYVNDFDANGQVEQIVTYYVKGREIPFADHADIMKQLPYLKKKYLLSKDFANASIQDLLGKDKLDASTLLEANTFASMYFENTGKGTSFMSTLLPDELQFSTLNAGSVFHNKNALLGGNFYDCTTETGRYDANRGNVLAFSDKKMQEYPLGDVRLNGQVKRIRPIKINNKTCFIFAINGEKAVVLGEW